MFASIASNYIVTRDTSILPTKSKFSLRQNRSILGKSVCILVQGSLFNLPGKEKVRCTSSNGDRVCKERQFSWLKIVNYVYPKTSLQYIVAQFLNKISYCCSVSIIIHPNQGLSVVSISALNRKNSTFCTLIIQ